MKDIISYVCLALIWMNAGCDNKGLQVASKDTLPAISEITVPYAGKTPIIDGVLDEDVWKLAAKVELSINNGSKAGKKPVSSTIVKLLWNEKNLYIGFTCFDRDIHSKFVGRDVNLWGAGYDEIEVAEMMLCEGNNISHYFEFNFNPRGALFDLEVKWKEGKKVLSDCSYNSNVRWATKIEGSLNKSDDKDRYWTVEIALLWSDIDMSVPRAGQTMRANFYRSDNSEAIHFSAWSPTYKSYFHIPERFGRLIFVREN